MTDRLEGKSIAITGAGRGIGRSLALRFAEEGARIVVSDLGGDGEGGGTASQAPAEEGVGFSMDELFRRFPAEFGVDLNYEPATFPPPVSG